MSILGLLAEKTRLAVIFLEFGFQFFLVWLDQHLHGETIAVSGEVQDLVLLTTALFGLDQGALARWYSA